MAADYPSLLPGQVHVWRAGLAVSARQVNACGALLGNPELAQADRLHDPAHRRQFIVRRGFLRLLLGNYVGIQAQALRFAPGPHGKPALESGQVHFNLSHAGELGVIAISRLPVGVDVAQVSPMNFLAAARAALPGPCVSELANTTAAAQADVFFRHWVRHEAQLKFWGLALGDAPPGVPVFDLPMPAQFRAAIATAIPNPQVQIFAGCRLIHDLESLDPPVSS